MIIPIRHDSIYARDVKCFHVNSEKDAAIHGIDTEWLDRENLTGRIQIPVGVALLEHHNRVIGTIINHAKAVNERFIRTSPIEMIVHTGGDFRSMTIVFTQNSRYEVIA